MSLHCLVLAHGPYRHSLLLEARGEDGAAPARCLFSLGTVCDRAGSQPAPKPPRAEQKGVTTVKPPLASQRLPSRVSPCACEQETTSGERRQTLPPRQEARRARRGAAGRGEAGGARPRVPAEAGEGGPGRGKPRGGGAGPRRAGRHAVFTVE